MSQEEDIRSWVSEMTGKDTAGDLMQVLKNGYLLALVMNRLSPKSVRMPKDTQAAFMALEQITGVVEAARKYGVEEHYLIRATDLWESKNPKQVMAFIDALGRRAQAVGFDGPKLGVAVVEGRKTEFTEEQILRARAAAPQTTSGVMYNNHGPERHLDRLNQARSAQE